MKSSSWCFFNSLVTFYTFNLSHVRMYSISLRFIFCKIQKRFCCWWTLGHKDRDTFPFKQASIMDIRPGEQCGFLHDDFLPMVRSENTLEEKGKNSFRLFSSCAFSGLTLGEKSACKIRQC